MTTRCLGVEGAITAQSERESERVRVAVVLTCVGERAGAWWWKKGKIAPGVREGMCKGARELTVGFTRFFARSRPLLVVSLVSLSHTSLSHTRSWLRLCLSPLLRVSLTPQQCPKMLKLPQLMRRLYVKHPLRILHLLSPSNLPQHRSIPPVLQLPYFLRAHQPREQARLERLEEAELAQQGMTMEEREEMDTATRRRRT